MFVCLYECISYTLPMLIAKWITIHKTKYIYVYSGEKKILSPADFVHLPTEKEMINL